MNTNYLDIGRSAFWITASLLGWFVAFPFAYLLLAAMIGTLLYYGVRISTITKAINAAEVDEMIREDGVATLIQIYASSPLVTIFLSAAIAVVLAGQVEFWLWPVPFIVGSLREVDMTSFRDAVIRGLPSRGKGYFLP